MIETAIVLALAIGAVAFTISLTKITRPMRDKLDRAANVRDSKALRWLHSLVTCPYCLAHWLAFGAVAIYRPRLVHMFLPLDYLVTAMAIAGASMLTSLVIRKALGLK